MFQICQATPNKKNAILEHFFSLLNKVREQSVRLTVQSGYACRTEAIDKYRKIPKNHITSAKKKNEKKISESCASNVRF